MTQPQQFALIIGLLIPVIASGVIVSLFEMFEIERDFLKSARQIKRG